jgi:hypothetical protein
MNTDRTAKLLLAAIALALWVLLMRPAFTPIPAKAAGPDSGQLVVVGEGQFVRVFLYTAGGSVYRFSPDDLSVRAHAYYDGVRGKYVNAAP